MRKVTVLIIVLVMIGSVSVTVTYAASNISFSDSSHYQVMNDPSQTQTITMDIAMQMFKSYLTRLGNPNLALHEVEEYTNNFYASYFEVNTGIFAFQMVIWKPGSTWTGGGGMMGGYGYTMMYGVVMPEPGPNMVWNQRYRMMGGMMGFYGQTATGAMTVTRDQAKMLAQQYLDNNYPGTSAGDADTYYGYYNVDVLQNGNPYGMLSVNGYTGQVWYHTWHGPFIQTVEVTPNNVQVPEFKQTNIILILASIMPAITLLLIRHRKNVTD